MRDEENIKEMKIDSWMRNKWDEERRVEVSV